MYSNFSFPPDVEKKLSRVSPEEMVLLADWDDTTGEKRWIDPDDSSVTTAQYLNLQALTERIGKFVIVTASGEDRILTKFLKPHAEKHGRLLRTILTSNSGHLYHDLDNPRCQEPDIIWMPGITAYGQMATVTNIHKLATTLGAEYPSIEVSIRELCAAVIYEFEGDNQSAIFKKFHAAADEIRSRLPNNEGKNIRFSTKDWPTAKGTAGYVDCLPYWMGKGHTTPIILDRICETLSGEPFVFVAGDSSSDYAMMEALAKKVPADRLVCISVGPGLSSCDEAYAAKNNGRKLVDITFLQNGKSPVEQFHEFLSHVGVRRRTLDLHHGLSDVGDRPRLVLGTGTIG